MNSELEMARARYLLGLISHDFQSPRILGFHGGSIETVEYIIEHGRLPGVARGKSIAVTAVEIRIFIHAYPRCRNHSAIYMLSGRLKQKRI